jgi:histidine ammonia-lyase
VLGIELMTAAAGVDLRAPLTPAPGVAAAIRELRMVVEPLTEDRPLAPDMEAINSLMRTNRIENACAAIIGTLR